MSIKKILIAVFFLIILITAVSYLNREDPQTELLVDITKTDQETDISLPEDTEELVTNQDPFWTTYEFDFFIIQLPEEWIEKEAVTGGIFMAGPSDNEDVWIGISKSTYINDASPIMLAEQAVTETAPVVSRNEYEQNGHEIVLQEKSTSQGARLEAYIGNVESTATVVSSEEPVTKKVVGVHSLFIEIRSADVSYYRNLFSEILNTIQYK